MKFSIIVPIYNVEKYLAECLDSILNQTFEDFEIICVNDSSTDASQEILLSYAERFEKIKVINNAENKGLSYSRNKGIEAACGDYIWFIDSDDYIIKDALEIIFRTVENQDFDILNFNYGEIVEGVVAEGYNIESTCKESLISRSGQNWFCEMIKENSLIIGAPFKIYKRAFLVNHGLQFYEGILHEDALFLVEAIICAQKVINIGDCLYVYRRRKNSITQARNIRRLDSYVIVINEIMTLWKNNNLECQMHEALSAYINKLLLEVRNFMLCFPDHKKLEIGKPEDQFFYELLQNANVSSLRRYVKLNEDEIRRIKSYEKRIVFGAGSVASELIFFLENHSIPIAGIAVTDVKENVKQVGQYKVQAIDDFLEFKKRGLVIIAVIKRNQKPIRDKLVDRGFENIMLIDTER